MEQDALTIANGQLLGQSTRATRPHAPPVEDLGEPSRDVRFSLALQSFIGRVLLIPFCGLLVLMLTILRGYRVEGMREVRRRFRELVKDEKTPLLICANHLTFIDSALMIWAMGSNAWYLFHFKKFSWNLPAGDFFKKKFHFRLVAYLTKCIFIHRDGSKEHKNSILSQCRHLLRRGEVVSIFPEGRRSRTGRFEPSQITFGVGKIIESMDECRVLCVYLRGDKQKTYSNYPPRGSRFRLLMEVITPKTSHRGREAYFDLASQIAGTIKKLEDQYFATC